MLSPFLTNAGGVAATGDELHLIKTQKLSFLQTVKSALCKVTFCFLVTECLHVRLLRVFLCSCWMVISGIEEVMFT